MRIRTVISGLSVVVTMALAVPAVALQGEMVVEDLRMVVGKSVVVDYPADIGRISTSDPAVVDAVPATAREFLLHGKGFGAATVVVWSKTGRRTMYNVSVETNLDPVRKLLRETFPNESITVQAARDSLSLTGTVSSKEVSDRATALLTPLSKSVLNNLAIRVAPVQKQVVLRVKFAELNRSYSQQFGVNLLSTGLGNTPGRLTTGQFAPGSASSIRGTIPGASEGTSTTFNLSDLLNVFAFRPDLNLAVTIKALEQQGVLQILAEPNLVTVNGKEASFLVGGEFPIPVLQGGGNAGAVTIQFREFGIRLTFTPNITENGTIKMYVKPEVSTIDSANAITISGFVIPALSTRRMETNVELSQGQSFMIAGLIDDRVNETLAKVPGLGNIPLLGTIFRSRNQNKAKTELVVMVTPELTEPLNPGDPKPGVVMPREFMPSLKPGDEVPLGLVPGREPVVPPQPLDNRPVSKNKQGEISQNQVPAPATAVSAPGQPAVAKQSSPNLFQRMNPFAKKGNPEVTPKSTAPEANVSKPVPAAANETRRPAIAGVSAVPAAEPARPADTQENQ
ncbi:MAG: pilus assembly protein N-terminal domain-containing protein [Bryobacter sp.]|nr:pilus assembly protein N-terminal domain-containing protein [Bryobacter sp.]